MYEHKMSGVTQLSEIRCSSEISTISDSNCKGKFVPKVSKY